MLLGLKSGPAIFKRPATPPGSPHFGAPRPERPRDPANPGSGVTRRFAPAEARLGGPGLSARTRPGSSSEPLSKRPMMRSGFLPPRAPKRVGCGEKANNRDPGLAQAPPGSTGRASRDPLCAGAVQTPAARALARGPRAVTGRLGQPPGRSADPLKRENSRQAMRAQPRTDWDNAQHRSCVGRWSIETQSSL